VLPWITETYPDQIQCIVRHQIQPWHPQSTLLHEASLAVERLSPSEFIPFFTRVFENQGLYTDDQVQNKTRPEIYAQLAQHLPTSIASTDFEGLLALAPNNYGNAMTPDLKWHLRYARQLGVHVSPTVYWNGLEEKSISSGWTLDQWQEWAVKNLQGVNNNLFV
jgi:protein-disulfide isomerase